MINIKKNLSKNFLPHRSRYVGKGGPGNIQTNYHNFDKIANYNSINTIRNATKLIADFFNPIYALASKPVFTSTSNSIIVHVFYYIYTNNTFNNNIVNNLGEIICSLFNRPVELRLVKIYYPYLDRYILAQYIAINTQKHKLFRIVQEIFGSISPIKNTLTSKLSNLEVKSILPSHIVGIKVCVSGRLAKERSRPQFTVQTLQTGSFAKENLSIIDYATFTTKNKKGAFTVKVWINQRANV